MSEIKIRNLFPVPIFHYKLENYQETNQELLNYILELQKKDKTSCSLAKIISNLFLTKSKKLFLCRSTQN